MNKTLKTYLDTTVMKHISDVREAFKLCANTDEIREVIKMIPKAFGEFDIAHIYEWGFEIVESYEEYDEMQYDDLEYEWFSADDLADHLTDEDVKRYKVEAYDLREAGHPYDPSDFSEFARDFCGPYNMSACLEAWHILIGE